MRLVEYIEKQRGKSITRYEAEMHVGYGHKDAYNGLVSIFRGVYGYGDYVYIDPSKSNEPRVSANTTNYYTLMMDNSPSWKKYPKRSKALICSTEEDYAESFGVVYRVYPVNGSKIGVCPKSDIWPSTIGIYTFEDINAIIDNIVDLLRIKINHPDVDYNTMIKTFAMIDKNKDLLSNKFEQLYNKTREFFEEYRIRDIPFLKFVEYLMNPEQCGFQLVKTGMAIPGKHEVWMDAPCVLVKVGTPDLN